jgi:hypothetical protein
LYAYALLILPILPTYPAFLSIFNNNNRIAEGYEKGSGRQAIKNGRQGPETGKQALETGKMP